MKTHTQRKRGEEEREGGRERERIYNTTCKTEILYQDAMGTLPCEDAQREKEYLHMEVQLEPSSAT